MKDHTKDMNSPTDVPPVYTQNATGIENCAKSLMLFADDYILLANNERRLTTKCDKSG
jgi:hypothetical protein